MKVYMIATTGNAVYGEDDIDWGDTQLIPQKNLGVFAKQSYAEELCEQLNKEEGGEKNEVIELDFHE